jgi:hypothetical protein
MITSFIMREMCGINREHDPAQLPAVIPPGAVAVAADPVALVPTLIAAAGWRYVEFFTANIRNPNSAREQGNVRLQS